MTPSARGSIPFRPMPRPRPSIGTASWAARPRFRSSPVRLFRWRNYRDYGTGVAGDLFVHLFSGMHFVTGAIGPTRVYATGGLRFWKDGRDVPDVLLGLYDYPKTDRHPAFNLALRVNFVYGAGEILGIPFCRQRRHHDHRRRRDRVEAAASDRAGLHHRYVPKGGANRVSARIPGEVSGDARQCGFACVLRARNVTPRRPATAITWITIAISGSCAQPQTGGRGRDVRIPRGRPGARFRTSVISSSGCATGIRRP